MSSFQTLLSFGSLTATLIFIRPLINQYLPVEFRDYINFFFKNLLNRFTPTFTFIIEEYDGLVSNHYFAAAEIYLSCKINPFTRRLRVCKSEKEESVNLTMEKNKEIVDIYQGVRFTWRLGIPKFRETDSNPQNLPNKNRIYELSFHKKYRQYVLGSYLPYVLNEAFSTKDGKKAPLKIFSMQKVYDHTSLGKLWKSINLVHPSTFDTLALESEMKKRIIEDLDMFIRRREFYNRVRKAWKRGYLLYGPPGTGKSSLIAAMANYLNFNIYDLELTEINYNSDLRKLLVSTANRSIIVVEDIDCTMYELQDRDMKPAKPYEYYNSEKKKQARIYLSSITLSGLLNFIDGLWSSCGDERIIVFTTNHKDRLDPALLRSEINHHPLFEVIEKLIEKVEVSPADIAGQLMIGEESDFVLESLVGFLENKSTERAVKTTG
ncbi:hypothetical protein GIB67_013854 [Kingdonia uniflora]|uniref:AAA+ ATPase domain-containing protein n=1 Tax=Kingdonia uniflora TaxID=39325 RepID=A0A7J7N3T1_9MAGN|nr:hypothetical protein GIB67_013854 [Kingdonia uniflora]